MFNPDEIHKRFDELFKSAGKLNRGQYSHYESFTETCNKLDRDRDLILRRAIDLCSLTDTHFDDIDFDDMTLNALWCSIKPTIRVSMKKWSSGKSGGVAKASKSKATKAKVAKPKTREPKNKIAVVDSKNKDLTKSEAISHIHLNLDIDSGLALEIYKYRVLKKVSNSEAALEKFCEQIKNGVSQSQIPIIKVVNHYCEGKWKEFKDSWTKELVDTQPNIEVATPVVEVADKIISLLTETLDISKDYAENIIQFRKTHNQPNNEMALLNWCSEISKASHLAERSVNDVLDFIFLKNYKSFNASWFVDYVSAETEALKKKEASDKVDPLTAKGLSYLSQGEKEKLIREKRANNIRMGIPNRDDEDSSHVFREKVSNNLITMEQNNE